MVYAIVLTKQDQFFTNGKEWLFNSNQTQFV